MFYVVDHGSDWVVETPGDGSDVVFSSVGYTLAAGHEIEILAATGAAAINLTGNGFTNFIYGNHSANRLDGGGGVDYLIGYGGDDIFMVDGDDFVVESPGEGHDIVFTSASWSMAAGHEIEVLAATGAAAINLTGNGFTNFIYGNHSANRLDGGGGIDYLIGYGGDDTYLVDGDDFVVESPGEGHDIVFTSASWSMAAGHEIEVLAATGLAAVDLAGNEFSQTIYGNHSANRLDGGAGSDFLVGYGGADTFTFTTAPSSGNIDHVVDFHPEEDRIFLGGVGSQFFAALASGDVSPGSFIIGPAALQPDDVLIYNAVTGTLLFDIDGNGANAATPFATLSTGLNLTASNFIVSGAPNNLPVITSGSSASIAENSAVSLVVYQTVATDPNGDAVSYSLTGEDAGRFTIDASGAVRLVSPADFETKKSYSFTVVASDSAPNDSLKQVTLTITDVGEFAAAYIVTETSGLNDSISQAQALDRSRFSVVNNANLSDQSLPSAQINGTISTTSDRDFFSVTLNQGELLVLDVESTTTLDSFVRVFSPGGAEVASNDDSITFDPGSSPHPGVAHNMDSLVRFRAPTSGTYTFSIASFSDFGGPTSSGGYSINVSLGPPASTSQIDEENINALISGDSWYDLNLTYGFPTSSSDYGSGEGGDAIGGGVTALNGVQRSAVVTALNAVSNVTNLAFTLAGTPGSAQMRYALSGEPDTAYAYYPGSGDGGDSWYNRTRYTSPTVGNYAWMTFIHETGHALGLKHGHESPALSPDRDSIEYSVMTYRGYIGADPGRLRRLQQRDLGLSADADDVRHRSAAAYVRRGLHLQFRQLNLPLEPATGAFSINGATQWTPGANRIFMTLWDGGGNDTYDLSAYSAAA